MWDRVRTRQTARGHVCFLIRTLRPHGVGAAIDRDVAINATQLALRVSISGDAILVLAAMCAGQQMFVATFNPAQWVVEFQRQCGEDDFFRIQPRLGAKPTTDIRRDDPDAAFLNAEYFAKRDAYGVRCLG